MNLTFHLIRKDLRTLRWPLALWVLACITHAVLRIAQHSRGDGAPTTAFWRSIDNSQRWDYLAVAFLPVMLIPALMHLDPLRGQLAFWKSVPIDRKRLLTAKSATLAVFFVALPLVCEIVYFASAGLASVLPTALADWAWRYLPGIVAVAVGCAFAPSLKWGIPGVAALLFVAFQFLGWPMGRDRFARPTPTSRFAVRSPVIELPSGARAEIDPKSYQFRRTRFVPSQVPGGVQKAEERLALTLKMTIEGLPEDTVVGNLVIKASSIQLPGRVVSSTDKTEFKVMTYSSEMPAQEQREDIGRQFFHSGELRPNQWTVDTEYFPFDTKDVDQQGTPVEGKVLLSLARRKRIANLPLVEGAQWRPGLHRFTLSNVSPPQSSDVSFRSTLTTVLADPNGASGGLGLLPSTNIALWLEHQTSPIRKYLQVIPSNVWRATGFKDRVFRISPQAYGDMSYGFVTDLTRSLKRLVLSSKFDPTEALRNQAAPLAVARLAEEQAQVRNWQLALIAYDDLGTIELPFKAIVPAPPKAREDQDPEELKAPLPSLGD